MDKKFIGITAVMLAVCLFIIIGADAVTITNEPLCTTSVGSSTAYTTLLFDKYNVININISLADSDFEDILGNPTKEEYKQASISINGETLNNVGFRVKGNSSLSSVARSSSVRYSFKVDMDHYLDGENLLGLTQLNLNNSFSDPSYMREYLSYSLLGEMGIPVPAFGYANVYVNGELLGLYLAVESIEKPFLARYYGNSFGNLYKSVGGLGSDLVYTNDKADSYSGLELKSGQKNSAYTGLIEMIKSLNQGEDLEKYLDVDEILRYFAVNNVLVNMDSYLGNFKHNYYLYEINGVFSILPWDYNMSFGGFGVGDSQSSGSLHIDSPVSGTTLAQRPLLGKLLEVPEYKALYHQYIKEFLVGPFELEKMQAEIDRIAAMIRPFLEQDPTKFYNMEQFEQAISEGTQRSNTENGVNREPERQAFQANQGLPSERGERMFPPEGRQLQPPQDRGEIGFEERGGGMMQGTSVGLVKFICDRIDNVTKQLNGDIPVPDNAFLQGERNIGPERPGNRPNIQGNPGRMLQPPNEMRVRIPNAEKDLYAVIGSILLLLVAIVLIFKRRTKHSV